ncbi:MAG: biopolymer transporter ExbD [Winogradskyella sp.]|uniref:ExbD/TolR family protein n=1 Tax=Winogradskyella sp. TaxID=1883156 RepID=UPI000F41449D|nr:biopolymer transporter ExbD [Winogradskyella sp.]RNC86226.1 MAG: biopolymer transporter ExbD [Winogradskyella sp.]
MRNLRRNAPTVNAGSMADIAFLLLIFFLVTTTISADKGLLRKLPALCDDCTETINERNILRIFINRNNEVMINDNIVEISEIKTITKDFIDNNGENVCDYCNGKQRSNSSDKPSEAVVSLKHDALTNYGVFIYVQDELSKAYLELRTAYAQKVYNKSPNQLTDKELIEVKKAYPFILSEVKVERY